MTILDCWSVLNHVKRTCKLNSFKNSWTCLTIATVCSNITVLTTPWTQPTDMITLCNWIFLQPINTFSTLNTFSKINQKNNNRQRLYWTSFQWLFILRQYVILYILKLLKCLTIVTRCSDETVLTAPWTSPTDMITFFIVYTVSATTFSAVHTIVTRWTHYKKSIRATQII